LSAEASAKAEAIHLRRFHLGRFRLRSLSYGGTSRSSQ
jgi:hypothetical protein